MIFKTSLLKKIVKWLGYILCIPLIYGLISLALGYITIERKIKTQDGDQSIFLSTNGVHLDIIIPIKDLDSNFLSGLSYSKLEKYLAIGWGDENFYLNTPTWGDLTFKNAFSAVFLKSSTLVHIRPFQRKDQHWVEVKITKEELQKLENYVFDSFDRDENGMPILVPNESYSSDDSFYKALGSYSCLKTCNSWVNSGFKESGLKSCYWTAFDFALLEKYQ